MDTPLRIGAGRLLGRTRIEDHHAEWLSLVETSGPFLTVPALKRALPDGLDATPAALPDVRVAHAEWRHDHHLQQRWVRWVLDEILQLRDAVHEATDADPSHLVAEQAVTVRPSYVVRDHTRDGSPAVMLVHPQAVACAVGPTHRSFDLRHLRARAPDFAVHAGHLKKGWLSRRLGCGRT